MKKTIMTLLISILFKLIATYKSVLMLSNLKINLRRLLCRPLFESRTREKGIAMILAKPQDQSDDTIKTV